MTPDEAAGHVEAFLDAQDRHVLGAMPVATTHDPDGSLRALERAALRVLLAQRKRLLWLAANPCDGEACEAGGAAHCHRCAEAETDKLLRERDQLCARIAAAEAQVARHFQIASRYVGEGSTWTITMQVLHAIDRALGGAPTAYDLTELADGVISFPPGTDAEEMERFRVAWDNAAGPERALTLNLDNHTATFRVKPWPAEDHADAVERAVPERTRNGDGMCTCECRYMNTGPICTHCGALKPKPERG